jgi:hypothetical protein
MAWVCERTIPTKRPLLVSGVSSKFCGLRVPLGNKDIFDVEYTTVQNTIRTTQTQEGNCSKCKLSKDMGTPKIIAISNQDVWNAQVTIDKSNRKERLSDVQCALCGGNHPANYKGCTVYKDLQKKIYPPSRLKQYTPPAQIKLWGEVSLYDTPPTLIIHHVKFSRALY